jgi:hypothetical protein
MTDCDLCGRAIPAVNPVRVFRPLLKFAYPEGVWKGLCELCLESAETTRVKVENQELTATQGKCSLCGKKAELYPVEMEIPDFSKGIVTENAMLCEECLKAAGESYKRMKAKEAKEPESCCGNGHQ